jgi:hypothetical protein
MAQLRLNIWPEENRVPQVRVLKVGSDVGIIESPAIPNTDPFPESLKMFLVRSEFRLGIFTRVVN